MRSKKPFVLLEIIIGFALVSVSILPFMRYPFHHMREELHMLFETELTRYAQERLCEIERHILELKVDDTYLFPSQINKKQLWQHKQVAIALPNGWESHYVEKIALCSTAQRRSNGTIYSLIHIFLSYEKKGREKMEFHTELVAQKQA